MNSQVNMKCPKCNSQNTKRPSVISERWRLGTQICLDCDYQGDWIDFVEEAPDKLEQLHRISNPIK
jgi:transposase-like protein